MNHSALDMFFYVFAGLASLFALRVVTASNPISGAFSLVMSFFCVAAIYAIMEAHFLAAIQILVYAGAVMVLFVFVIMLLNADLLAADFRKGIANKIMAGFMAVALFSLFAWCLHHGEFSANRGTYTAERIEQMGGNVRVLSEAMFSDFILPFELTSILLLVGIIGSVALAKREKKAHR